MFRYRLILEKHLWNYSKSQYKMIEYKNTKTKNHSFIVVNQAQVFKIAINEKIMNHKLCLCSDII